MKVSGIVSRYANYRDNDRMLNIFTDNGIIGAIARGCRRPQSPLLCAAELFVYGEFVLYEKQGKYTVNACDVRESFYPLRQDTDRLAAGTHMLEMVNALSEDGIRCSGLLELVYYCLSYTAYTELDPLDMALCFTVKSLALQGYTPSITCCASCGQDMRGLERMGFDVAAGGAVCGACMGTDSVRISALSLEAMRRMLLLQNRDIKKVQLPKRTREELRQACGRYAEHIIERKLHSIYQINEIE